MILRHFTLSPDEIEKLSDFMARLNGRPASTTAPAAIAPVQPRIREMFQAQIYTFLISEGLSKDVLGKNPARFLKKNSVKDADHKSVIYLYDFVTYEFRQTLRDGLFAAPNETDLRKDVQDLSAIIDALVKLRKDQMELSPHPFAALISNTQIMNMSAGPPDSLFDTYIGYRRSSETGDIIRFVLRIQNSGIRRVIKFDNRYHRNDDTWYVEGTGHEIQNTLYLIGHCTNHNDVSRGLRIMALRQDRQTDTLYGLLTSMDREDPICARVFLIKSEAHTLKDVDDSDFDALADYVLNRHKDLPYNDMLKVIRDEAPPEYAGEQSELFQYICNTNFSVLKCNPNKDKSLIDLEIRYRTAFLEHCSDDLRDMRKTYKDMMRHAVERFEQDGKNSLRGDEDS